MAKAPKKKTDDQPDEIHIIKLQTGRFAVAVKGVSPLIVNSMSEKAMRGILAPTGKKTDAEKRSTLKHNPPEEFRGSMYIQRQGPTLLGLPAVAFKRALASAALDVGNAPRTQIERLVWAIGEYVPVYGIPQLRMDVVRNADPKRTPDVRTRACLREWCAVLQLSFVKPVITETIVANLLGASGLIRGVGDFRQEKGAGSFGQFELVAMDDPDVVRLMAECGRDAQQAAADNPVCYNEETESLFTWWLEDARRRGRLSGNGRAAAAATEEAAT